MSQWIRNNVSIGSSQFSIHPCLLKYNKSAEQALSLWPLQCVCTLSPKWAESSIPSLMFVCPCQWQKEQGLCLGSEGTSGSGFGGLVDATCKSSSNLCNLRADCVKSLGALPCLFGHDSFTLIISWVWESVFLSQPTLSREKQIINKVSSPGLGVFVFACCHFWELHAANFGPKVLSGFKKLEGFLQVCGRHLSGILMCLAAVFKPPEKWVRIQPSACSVRMPASFKVKGV